MGMQHRHAYPHGYGAEPHGHAHVSPIAAGSLGYSKFPSRANRDRAGWFADFTSSISLGRHVSSNQDCSGP